MRKRTNSRYAIVLLCIAVATASVTSCGRNDASKLYEAEKALYNARSLREKAATAVNRPEFLERTLQSYRDIVNTHRHSIEQVEGLEEIVVSAQMDLARLEYQAGTYESARKDFETAYTLARNIPEARANALYSMAIISSEMGDHKNAITFFEKFHREFLEQESLLRTAGMNSAYCLTPLKLFELYMVDGNENEARTWLVAAETSYRHIIQNGENPAQIKEMHFNLLTVYLQGKHWKKSLDKVQEMKQLYKQSPDVPPLLYLEAKIYHDGYKNKDKAFVLYERIYEEYPASSEARIALLSAGSILMDAQNHERAKTLYSRVIERYPESSGEAAEAAWQLARITEMQGDWLNASLQYKSIYIHYPGTVQGFEAPLRVAKHFEEHGEPAAAEAAYGKAIDHYRELISKHVDPGIKVTAENYVVRALSEQGKWDEAATRLIDLPDLYPAFIRLRGNYLMAASIYEEELGDSDRAVEILQRCIEKYPGTDLAVEAERQLRRLKDLK